MPMNFLDSESFHSLIFAYSALDSPLETASVATVESHIFVEPSLRQFALPALPSIRGSSGGFPKEE
jgi:hypothetical protein